MGEQRAMSRATAHATVQQWVWTHKLALGLSVAIFVFWTYLVQRFGTMFPPAVYMHTASYIGPPAGAAPPHDWRPSSRIVVTLSTRPDRLVLGMLMPTIQTILAQDTPADALYLNIPHGKNIRTGELYVVPPDLEQPEGLTIVRCDDKGPLTKLYPALEQESDPDTIVISIDDDKLYPPELIRTIAWNLEASANTAVGCCGWSVWWWPNHWQHVVIPYWQRGQNGVYTDVLQGVSGIGYRRGFFNVSEFKFPADECYTV